MDQEVFEDLEAFDRIILLKPSAKAIKARRTNNNSGERPRRLDSLVEVNLHTNLRLLP
jgi:adenylate kinase